TLTVPVTLTGQGELAVDLWFHTEPTDVLHVEASADDGATWQPLEGTLRAGADVLPVPGTVSGDGLGRWWEGRFALTGHAGEVDLRLRYTTDTVYSGRGAYVERLTVSDGGTTVFDDARPADRALAEASGWTRVDATGEQAAEPVVAVLRLAGSLDAHASGGAVAGPIAHQLATALEQARRHLAGQRPGPASRALERVIRHLDNPKRPD